MKVRFRPLRLTELQGSKLSFRPVSLSFLQLHIAASLRVMGLFGSLKPGLRFRVEWRTYGRC